MRRALLVCALVAGCGGTAGDSSGSSGACTALFAWGLDVQVVSASSSAPLCDATVSITDGTYQETLKTLPTGSPDGGANCTFVGAGERAGTYRIDAKSGSSEKVVDGIVVTKDACHVQPQSVRIVL